jgi:hypothetical protein
MVRSNWLVRAAALLLVVLIAAVSLSVIGSRTHQAHATSSAPLQLEDLLVDNTDFSVQASYHRGQLIILEAVIQNMTGVITVYTAHPAVYHSSYRLLDSAEPETASGFSLEEPFWMVTVPKRAPLGLYKYWFTLHQAGVPDQTMMIPFTVVK